MNREQKQQRNQLMRERAEAGVSYEQIAGEFGVSLFHTAQLCRVARTRYLRRRRTAMRQQVTRGTSVQHVAQRFGVHVDVVAEALDDDAARQTLEAAGLLIGLDAAAQYVGIHRRSVAYWLDERILIPRQRWKGQHCIHQSDVDKLIKAGYGRHDRVIVDQRQRLLDVGGRQCPVCQRVFVGDPRRIYCSAECQRSAQVLIGNGFS